MKNIGGTQDEQERRWTGQYPGVYPATMPGGQSCVSSQEERSDWEIPVVQATPVQAHTSIIAQPKEDRLVEVSGKICVLGDSGVGKTSIVQRYALDKFNEGYYTTCGARVTLRKLSLHYPKLDIRARLEIQIWDVTGERRGGLSKAFFRGAGGALVVGDAVRLETQIDMWKWIEELRAEAGNVPVVIVVNKTDIIDRQEFDYLLMEDIANEYGCRYTMASARTNFHVDKAFRLLCDYLVMRKIAMEGEDAKDC